MMDNGKALKTIDGVKIGITESDTLGVGNVSVLGGSFGASEIPEAGVLLCFDDGLFER